MRLQTRNNPDNADTNRRKENVTLRCICWNIRGWGGKQDRIKRKRSKIKSEIESFDITILTETHLSKEIGEIQKMGKYLQEFTLQHVHDRSNASGRKGVTIGIRKTL